MLVSSVFTLLGLFLMAFFLWRRLKEDYSSEIVFSLAALIILGISLGYFVSLRYFPGWWFWLEAFGAFLGFSLAIFKYDLKFFETFEAVFIGLIFWFGAFIAGNLIKVPGYPSFFYLLSALALIGLFYFLDRRYKNFSWYKSGRIGVSGLMVAGIFFLIRVVIATFFPFVLSFAGRGEIILSAICAFSLFLLIYNIARE